MGSVYRPKHQKQLTATDKYGKYNCTAVSAAIAGDRATLGGVIVSGKDIRAASSEPIPDTNPNTENGPGLTPQQAVDALYRLTRVPLVMRRTSWATMASNLNARGVLLPGDYDQMGAFSCQPSFRDLHSMYLNNRNSAPVTINGTTYPAGQAALTYDPLCGDYRWVPMSVLRKYAEKYARAVGYTGGVIYATTRVTPLVEAN